MWVKFLTWWKVDASEWEQARVILVPSILVCFIVAELLWGTFTVIPIIFAVIAVIGVILLFASIGE